MVDARIELVEHDPRWAERFESERGLLATALAPWLVGPIEHIGSTAVPGLAAKPVIDIAAPVASLEASHGVIDALRPLGYLHHPYKAEEMHWFCKPSPALRTHHLHVLVQGGVAWHERLALRDALRADPALRQAYARLKHELALRHGGDREAYTEGKAPFLRATLERLPLSLR